MNEVWDLTPLYKGFDDPAYEADMAAMKALVADFTAFSKELPNMEPVAGLRRGVELLEKLADLSKLFGYANLRSATNTKDPEPGSYMGRIMAIRRPLKAAASSPSTCSAIITALSSSVTEDSSRPIRLSRSSNRADFAFSVTASSLRPARIPST